MLPNSDLTVTAKVPFTSRHMAAINAVFGEAGTNLARDIMVNIIIGDAPSRTIVNGETGEKNIFINSRPWRKDMPSVIHEFAHYYHNFFWLQDSMICPPSCHEACAIYAELVLSARHPWHGDKVLQRMTVIRDHPLPMYPAAFVKVWDNVDRFKNKTVHEAFEILIKDHDNVPR